jgi:hypothetical protein
VLLRQVERALLLKTRANVVLTQGFELGPLLGASELLGETALRWNGTGPSGLLVLTAGLLVLTAGRRRVGNLTPLECLVEAVELRKNEFAVAFVLVACVLRLPGRRPGVRSFDKNRDVNDRVLVLLSTTIHELLYAIRSSTSFHVPGMVAPAQDTKRGEREKCRRERKEERGPGERRHTQCVCVCV